jgi:hypothetical protein
LVLNTPSVPPTRPNRSGTSAVPNPCADVPKPHLWLQFQLAARASDREDLSGEYGQWNPAIAPPRLVADAEAVNAIRGMEDGVISEMKDVLTTIGLLIEEP